MTTLLRRKRVLVLESHELRTIKQALQYTICNEHRGNVAERARILLRQIESTME
jgi:hypothetical protein